MPEIFIDKKIVEDIVKAALKEDIGPKDVTTSGIIPKGLDIRAHIISREEGIACGLGVAEKVFSALDENTRFRPLLSDGDLLHEGKVIAYVEGKAQHILNGDRVALNFLGKMSGIATKTRKFVEGSAGSPAKIMDTRKTTPLLRKLERYAVRVGGGYNHRDGLWDQVLIKDNHLEAISCQPSAISNMIENIRKKIQRNIKVEIEIDNLKQFEEALKGKPDIIMLDNMSIDDIKKCMKLRNKIGKYPLIEVSGNITLENIKEYSATGVERISIGSLTHSVNSIDLSLEVDATL